MGLSHGLGIRAIGEDNTQRQFSMMNYLNANWKAQDGGELLVHQKNNNQSIAPPQGKTVFFKSDKLEHEVLVTNERRMSVCVWVVEAVGCVTD